MNVLEMTSLLSMTKPRLFFIGKGLLTKHGLKTTALKYLRKISPWFHGDQQIIVTTDL